MKSLLKLTVVVLSLGMIGQAFAVTGDAEAGKKKAVTCGGCHGPDGNSGIAINPKLAGQSEKYLIKQINDFKSGKRKNAVMAAQVGGLKEQDIADISAYYASQVGKPGETKQEFVALGEKIYRGGNPETGVAACAGCHGANGKGMLEAGFPRLAGQHATYTSSQLKAFRAAGRDDLGAASYRTNDSSSPDEQGMMRDIAKKLTDKELQAVSEYIQGLY